MNTPRTSIPYSNKRREWYVYLLCFSENYKHARHYIGATGALEYRLLRHKQGNGARLIEVITEAGLTFHLARLWPCASQEEAYALERRLKGRHGSRPLCPLCRPDLPIDKHVFMKQGHHRLEWRDTQARPRRPMKSP